MTWQVLNKVMRLSGIYAYVDIVLERQNDDAPYIFAVVDEKRFRDFLNNPDNRFFRTRPGQL